MSKEDQKKEEYTNDLVHVLVHRKPHCIVEYEVDAYRPICVASHKKAAKSVSKDVVVPGFRKGKAPPELVTQRYPQELDKRWQETIADQAYKEAAKLAKVPIINQDVSITFKMEKHTRDGAKLTLSFESTPEIPSIDPAKCVLEKIERPLVNKDKVNETIRQTQMFFGEWKKAEDHPIKEGDFILLDVEIIDEDPPEKLFTNTRFEVADRSMAQWMKKLVLGKKVGDVLEGVSEPDPSLSEEEQKEYPPKKVRLTIKELEKVKLPELTDEFAAQLGLPKIDELYPSIETLLNKKADEHVREEQREQVTEFLISHHFDIPATIIEQETKFRLQQMIDDPNFKKQWENSSQQERTELIESTKKQSEKAVRIFYLCRKIAADQKINVSPSDVPPSSTKPLEALLYPSADRHDPRQPDVKQAEAYSRILLEKTEDWVISHARTAPAGKKVETKTAPKKTADKETESSEKKVAPKKAAAKTAEKKPAPKKTTTKAAKSKEEKPKPKPKTAAAKPKKEK